MVLTHRRDPKPEIQRLEELALAVRSGDIKLPRFQRPFVWRRSDMIALLDSIYRGYPIGSLLVWNSSLRLTSERSIQGLRLNEEEQLRYPTSYLLDGQQRLTTLCGSLFWDGEDRSSLWNISFDLLKEEFIHPKEAEAPHLFPLRSLIDTSAFLRQCGAFVGEVNREVLFQNAERLLRAIKDYKVAVVKIGDISIEEVAPIFERINSTGRKLTIVDLMMAATWSEDFDLNREIEALLQISVASDFGEIKNPILLRSISAAAGLGINKGDIQKLRGVSSDDLSTASLTTRSAVGAAIEFLKEPVKVLDYSRIPFGLQFTHVVEFFRIRPNPEPDQIEELRSWFWYTSFTRYFSSANSGQNSADLAKIRGFAVGDQELLYERRAIDLNPLLFSKFNLRDSRSTTFALLLSQSAPVVGVDGSELDSSYMRSKDSRHYSSVLPHGHLYADSNISKVIHQYSRSPQAMVVNFAGQHLLDAQCVIAFSEGDWDGLVRARASLIQDLVRRLTGCEPFFSQEAGAQLSRSFDEDDDVDD